MRKIYLKVDEILKERNMTQLQLSELTEIRQGTISEMSRGIREQVSLRNLARIADALEIDDITKLIGMKNQ